MKTDDRRLVSLVCAGVFLGCALAYLLAWAFPAHGAELPGDKRLDQRVKVFCKSKGLKEVFADLSARTGVRIRVGREVCGEQPIIYFHERPLRDVMSEVAGLYGYHWLVSGKQDEYTYELREDVSHAHRRDQAAKDAESNQGRTLLEAAEQYLNDYSESVKAGRQFSGDGSAKMLSVFGIGFFRNVIASGGFTSKFGNLLPPWQNAVCDHINQQIPSDEIRKQAEEMGMRLAVPEPVTPADMANADISVAMTQSDITGLPCFKFSIQGNKRGQTLTFPPTHYFGDNAQAAPAMQSPVPAKGNTDVGTLPTDGTKITIDKLRWLPKTKGLLLGDVLEGVAKRTGRDVIADYHFDGKPLGAIKDQTLKQVMDLVCRQYKYTRQGDSDTIRLRYDLWYKEPKSAGSPDQLVDSLWSRIEQSGALDLSDLFKLGDLADDQINWPGFRLIPGAVDACKHPALLRLRKSLSEEQEKQARGDGLPVPSLSPQQFPKLDDWMRETNAQASAEELRESSLHVGPLQRGYSLNSNTPAAVIAGGPPGSQPPAGQMATVQFGRPPNAKASKPVVMVNGQRVDPATMGAAFSSYSTESVFLSLPKGRLRPSSIRIEDPLSEQERKECAAQRKADKEADVIEVLAGDR